MRKIEILFADKRFFAMAAENSLKLVNNHLKYCDMN